MADLPEYPEYISSEVLRLRDTISARLRDSADRIDRMGPHESTATPHGNLVGEVIHELTTMLANMLISNLIANASAADMARVQPDPKA